MCPLLIAGEFCGLAHTRKRRLQPLPATEQPRSAKPGAFAYAFFSSNSEELVLVLRPRCAGVFLQRKEPDLSPRAQLNNDQLNAHHTIAAATTSAATIMMNALNLFIGFSLYFLPTGLLTPRYAGHMATTTNPTALTSGSLPVCKPGYEHAELI